MSDANGTDPRQQYGDGIRIPMDDLAFIKREQQEHPYCSCGRKWAILFVPVLNGYVRQCPSCLFTASYCECHAIWCDGSHEGNIGML